MYAITPATVSELNPSLLAFAFRRVQRRADAEDLVQETWISALASVQSFEGRSHLRTWLLTILRRRIADRFGKQRAMELFEEQVTEFALGSVPESAEQRAEVREEAAFARAALTALTEQERRAITLCDLEDHDRDAVCVELGVTRSHLRVLLYRGRQKLQILLSKTS